MREWWRWALVSPDGVAPIRMVSVYASVSLPLHHKVQKFFSGTGSPGWSRKKGRKTVVVVVVVVVMLVWQKAIPCDLLRLWLSFGIFKRNFASTLFTWLYWCLTDIYAVALTDVIPVLEGFA